MLRFFLSRKKKRINIQERILRAVKNKRGFAFSSPIDLQVEKFRHLVNKFVRATTYRRLEKYGSKLTNFVLSQHDKSDTVGPVSQVLNIFELYGKYKYKSEQRLHFPHQPNVFLLGLYLYHGVPHIRNAMDKEMEKTTEVTEIRVDHNHYTWRYSGGNKYGEFLYRWRLASLCHDIGTSISLLGNDTTEIEKCLKEIFRFHTTDIKNLEDLRHFECQDILEKLDKECDEVSLMNYMDYQFQKPYNRSVYYDHGLISSLIFLRLMNEEFANHRHNQVSFVGSTNIIWQESFLSGSIMQAAIAIAFHNLDQHKDALEKSAPNHKIFNLEERPLAWLLKISDVLQEWSKPKADEEIMDKELAPTHLDISCRKGQIVVRNFPADELRKTKQKLDNYTSRPGMIRFAWRKHAR